MPQDTLQRPDAETIRQEKEHWEDVWQEGFASIRQAYRWVLGDYSIWDNLEQILGRKVSRPKYNSGLPNIIVSRIVDASIPLTPRFHRRPLSDRPEAIAAANRIENALLAIFHDAMVQNQSYATKVNGRHLAIGNYTPLYVGLDTENMERPVRRRGEDKEDFGRRMWEWESSRFTWNPIRIEVPAVGEVLMDPLKKNPGVALRHRVFHAHVLDAIVKEELEKKGASGPGWSMDGKDPYEPIACIERWTPSWYALALKDGDLIYRKPNTWGFQPHMHTFGGNADLPIQAVLDGSDKGFNPKWYVEQAVLFHMMDTIKILEMMTANDMTLLTRNAHARIGTTADTGEVAEAMRGDILPFSENEIWLEKVPQVLGQSMSFEGFLKQMIEEGTISLLESGQPQGNVDTATHVIMLADKAQRRFLPTIAQVNQLYSMAASNVLKLAVKLHRDHSSAWDRITIGKDELRITDINDRFYIDAQFKTIDSAAQMQQERLMMDKVERGLASRKRFWAIEGLEDTTTEAREIDKDRARLLPEVSQEVGKVALRAIGMGRMADRMEDEQAAQQLVGPDGLPLGTGTNGANGRA